jgi:hypothetical protein
MPGSENAKEWRNKGKMARELFVDDSLRTYVHATAPCDTKRTGRVHNVLYLILSVLTFLVSFGLESFSFYIYISNMLVKALQLDHDYDDDAHCTSHFISPHSMYSFLCAQQ